MIKEEIFILLKRIGDFAFYNCINLKRITIPDNVMSIGDHAFSKCRGLFTNISIQGF